MLDASQGVEPEEPARVGEVVQVGGLEVVTDDDPHLWWQVRHRQGRGLQLGLHLSGFVPILAQLLRVALCVGGVCFFEWR